MPLYSPGNTAEQNLGILSQNTYPGRLLIVGFAGETAVQAYAIMGRSEGSRNRIFVEEPGGIVGTEVFDLTHATGDQALTIYDAMRSVKDLHIVTNGNQTDTVVRYLRSGKTFQDAMDVTEHEPDDPNFTPRISAFHHWDAGDDESKFGISVIRKDPNGGSIRTYFDDSSPEFADTVEDENVGYCVHTYLGDGNPLPSFDEAPFVVPVQERVRDMAEMLWDNLNPDNRVAVVAKTISLDGFVDLTIINRHKPTWQ